MRKLMISVASIALVAIVSANCGAQIVVYDPIVPEVVTTPPVGVYSVSPVAPLVTTYYAPAAVPVTTTYLPAPTVVYRAIAPQPVVAYSPVVTSYAAPVVVSQTVVAARPVVVRPKYYVPGQPVRNFLRAITP